MTADVLPSYLAGAWTRGGGAGVEVPDAVTGETVCAVSADGLDLDAAGAHARSVGRSELQKLTFPARAAALKAAAAALQERKAELYDLSARAGATRRDAAVDVDGGIGTAMVFASLARKELPGDVRIAEDAPVVLGRAGTFAGRHVLTTPHGLALQINAFNFPVWGMLEKLAPALLAG